MKNSLLALALAAATMPLTFGQAKPAAQNPPANQPANNTAATSTANTKVKKHTKKSHVKKEKAAPATGSTSGSSK
jgi:hypothetical protein